MLIAGPAGAALAYVWMPLGQEESLMLGVIGPLTLLGLSFAVLVAPLTAPVMSSVDQADQGPASGINNAASRIAPLAHLGRPPVRERVRKTMKITGGDVII